MEDVLTNDLQPYHNSLFIVVLSFPPCKLFFRQSFTCHRWRCIKLCYRYATKRNEKTESQLNRWNYFQVGYATLYTMFPVFSLVLDQDISSYIAVTYPELYKELSKGRSLSYKTFFMWVLISIYQGELNR